MLTQYVGKNKQMSSVEIEAQEHWNSEYSIQYVLWRIMGPTTKEFLGFAYFNRDNESEWIFNAESKRYFTAPVLSAITSWLEEQNSKI